MRICLVYDCLFPWTVGGGERWYRGLAERLVADGHEVTYLTLEQWEPGSEPAIEGVRVVAVGPRMELYSDGNRRIAPPLRFGAGVLLHLLRHGRDYDAVHASSFPYFSLLAAEVARPIGRYSVSVDWFEVWSRQYWRGYLGPVGGRIGWAVQRLCAWMPQKAYAFSRLYARRLEAIGPRRGVTLLSGMHAGRQGVVGTTAPSEPPTVVYAGRMIPEKRAWLVVDAIRAAREQIPDLRGRIFGSGPDAPRIAARIDELGLNGIVEMPGFVATDVIEEAMQTATCLVQPSSREGYGLVVVESSAVGVPVVVVDGADNAAVELIEEGENGYVAQEATGESIARAIVACHEGGTALRTATFAWYSANAARLSMDTSLREVAAGYARPNARS